MSKTINVLIVENEFLIVHVLKNAFKHLSNDELQFSIKVTKCCTSANTIIEEYPNLDLVLLNTNIPPIQNGKLIFIEDIGLKIKKEFPKAKLILFSSVMDNYKVSSLLETINPDSIMVKSDIDFNELLEAIKTVLSAQPYYCKVILRFIRQQVSHNIKIDRTDKAILYYLSKGNKTKDLPNLVHLSCAAIERRKRKLKDAFCVVEGGDQSLLELARVKGFI